MVLYTTANALTSMIGLLVGAALCASLLGLAKAHLLLWSQVGMVAALWAALVVTSAVGLHFTT